MAEGALSGNGCHDVLTVDDPIGLHLEMGLEPFVAYRSDPTVARYQGWDAPFSTEAAVAFIDEMQQIISDGIKLVFEQFRDLGGTIIAAHQTGGQLRRQGTDLGDTIDSCSAMKQVFRASDLDSLERLEKLRDGKIEDMLAAPATNATGLDGNTWRTAR